MTWTSRGIVTLPAAITSTARLIRGGVDGKIFFSIFDAFEVYRYSLPTGSGAVTRDTGFVYTDQLGSGYLNDAGNVLASQLGTGGAYATFSVSTTTLTNYMLRSRAIAATELATLCIVSSTRIFTYDGTRLVARSLTTGVAVGSSSNITLASGANASGLSNIRLLSDGTHIWLTGVSSNNRTARGWCYLLSDGSRVSARDFSQTFTHNVSFVTTNAGGHFFVLASDGSQLDRYEFVITLVPTGTVANQTGTPGVAFSLDLDDDITGATSYSVRNTSLSGTGLSLNTTTGVLSGTPTASHVGAHTIELTATNTCLLYTSPSPRD